jgi:hypothetical protein
MVEVRAFVELLRARFGIACPLAHARPFVGEGRQLVWDAQEEAQLDPDFCLIAEVRGQLVLTPASEAFTPASAGPMTRSRVLNASLARSASGPPWAICAISRAYWSRTRSAIAAWTWAWRLDHRPLARIDRYHLPISAHRGVQYHMAVQLRVGRLVGDGARGRMPPTRRHQPGVLTCTMVRRSIR